MPSFLMANDVPFKVLLILIYSMTKSKTFDKTALGKCGYFLIIFCNTKCTAKLLQINTLRREAHANPFER